MPFWGKRDEGEQHFKQAKNYADPKKEEFNLRRAIEEFKLAISLKPDEPHYHLELGFIYLVVPQLAVARQVDVPFSIRESSNRALAEFQEAVRLSDDYSEYLALAYLWLGDHKKVIRFASEELKEGWEVSLPKENVELILKTIGRIVVTGWNNEEIIEALLEGLFDISDLVAERGKDEPAKFAKQVAKLAKDCRWLKVPPPQPEEAMRHLEQAVTYRNLSKYRDAMKEVEQASQFAPSLSWWHNTLCELGS